MTTFPDPKTCPHPTAEVEAYIGNPGGLPFEVIAPEQRDLDGIHVTLALGVCDRCLSRVVSVRTREPAVPTAPAWTSPWARLVRDGGS